MNSTLRLIREIGTPFEPNKIWVESEESEKLYKLAFKNRVGLLYLDILEKNGSLHRLKDVHQRLLYRHHETLVTISRIAKVLNEAKIDYSVIKTIKPYRAIPNDTDIIFMSENKKFKYLVKILKGANYHYLKYSNAAPEQIGFYDPRANEIRYDKKGGIYHIDIYKELAADYILYLDKRKLQPYQQILKILDGQEVRVLKPEAELAVTLMHGVFPEQSYQLQDFYTTLYFLVQMNIEQINSFIGIVVTNHIKNAVKASFSITARLHEAAFGFVPENVSIVLNSIQAKTNEGTLINKANFKTPYIYSFGTFFIVFWERALDFRGLLSFFVQGVHMLNPFLLKSVIKSLVIKQKHGTYKQV